MSPVAAPWIAQLVLMSWRSVKRDKRPPLPSEVLASFVFFGTVSLIGNSQPRIASVLGWGIVVATGLNLFPEAVAPNFGGGNSVAATTPSGPSAVRPIQGAY